MWLEHSLRSWTWYLILAMPVVLRAQIPEHEQWFFGVHAAMDLSGPVPAAMTGSALNTMEGVTSMCDAEGMLLFYTDGVQVWDRDHAQMPEGFGLNGNASATQSALVVPFPDDDHRYYLFTAPSAAGMDGGWSGLAWSVVDMAANNGSGDVVLKNQVLSPSITEKLTATRHANGVDVWVLCHRWNSDAYLAYLVTCQGIEGPVESAAGRWMGPDGNMAPMQAIDCMQFDPAGTRLAATWGRTLADGTTVVAQLDILPFDNATGIVGDGVAITHDAPNADRWPYGVCFSPGGTLLYVSQYGVVNGAFHARILQYDVTVPDPATTESQVAEHPSKQYGSLQKAPDGTIYVARLGGVNFLSRIMLPDLPGAACTVVEQAVDLGAGISTFGLPNHWDGMRSRVVPELTLRDTTWCPGMDLFLDATVAMPPHQPVYTWSTGATTPTIRVDAPGVYSVEVRLGCNTVLTATCTVQRGGTTTDLGADRLAYDDRSVWLEAPHVEGATYLWNTGATEAMIPVEEPGRYSLEMVLPDGCLSSGTVNVILTNCHCHLFVPNAFTPDGDGLNDHFAARGDCLLGTYRLEIFDRWGRSVFVTHDPDQGWDGHLAGMPVGPNVLVWQLHHTYYNGSGYVPASARGTVTVVR